MSSDSRTEAYLARFRTQRSDSAFRRSIGLCDQPDAVLSDL